MPSLPREWDRVDPALRRVFAELVSGRAKWPLFLHGNIGTGKTRACLALADVVHTASYWRLSGLVDAWLCPDVRPAIQWQLETRELIVVDELGARRLTTELEVSVLREVLELREAHAGRASIFVSNLGPERIAGYLDERLASRLCCGTIFHLTADCDRRFAS